MASSHRTDPPLPIDTSEQGRGIRSCRICDDALETAPHYLWGLIGRSSAIREDRHERLEASMQDGARLAWTLRALRCCEDSSYATARRTIDGEKSTIEAKLW